MKNKKISNYLFFLIFIVIILVVFKTKIFREINYESRKKMYGEAFDENGVINNQFFNIYKDCTHSEQTTKGINEAIQYAYKNNIKSIKLEKGEYLIDGVSKDDSQSAQEKGIVLTSNIEFDLNGSTLKHVQNDKTNYSLFTIINQSNISIKNGVLSGDKEEHINAEGGAHDKGFGIEIRGSNDISIDDLQICNFTGDGILARELSNGNKRINNKNIKIKNCNIFNNRRQGISIVSAENVQIYGNEIHNIKGKNPQACIDIETDGWAFQKNENIQIINNKLYGSNSKLAIMAYSGFCSGNIEKNEIEGRILICNVNDYIMVKNNIFNNGSIIVNKDFFGIKEKFYINNVILEENIMKNGQINIIAPNNVIVRNNNMETTNFIVQNTNIAIKNNISDKEITLNYENETELNNKKVYYYQNSFAKIINQNNIELIQDEEETDKFIAEIMMGVK